MDDKKSGISENENITEQTDEQENQERKKLKKDKKISYPVLAIIAVTVFLFVYLLINFSTLYNVFSKLWSVFFPVFLGGALAFILNPLFLMLETKVFGKLKNRRLVRAISLTITYLVLFAAIGILVMLIVPSLIDSITDFVTNLDSYLDNATLWINDLVSKITKNDDLAEYIDTEELKVFLLDFLSSSGSIMETISSKALEILPSLVTSVKNIVLALFISIYVLVSKERLKAQARKLCAAVFPSSTNGRIMRYVYLTNRTFSTYFIGMAIDAVLVGVITFFGMLVLGIPYAPLVAVTVGITNVIPIFGPFIGGIPSFLIIFISDPVKALIFVILILVIQQIDGNIIAPKIHGSSTGLSSLGVMISIIVMGDWFGILGMIIGVPFVAVLVTVITEFIEHRLEVRGKPTDTAHYFTDHLTDEIYEKHEHVWVISAKKLGSWIKRTVLKLISLLKKKDKKDSEKTNEKNKK